MKTIYILGFGCGGKHDITLRSLEILRASDRVFVRTMVHPSAAILDEYGIEYTSFDELYEQSGDFEEVYDTICETVISAPGEAVSYIVPGSSFIAERAVGLIVSRAQCEVKIVPAVSFIDGIFSALRTDAADSFKMLDALSLDTQRPDPSCMNIICQVYDRSIASDVKLELEDIYPDETPVYIINAASTDEEKIIPMSLWEIDRCEEIDHLTSLVIPPVDYTGVPRAFSSLKSVVRALRGEGGCPWDMEQTHESLIPYVTEEAYEVVSAIKRGDADNLCEELGDLLLQVVMHADIASEYGDFTMEDVIEAVTTKMIRRHPHVFAGKEIDMTDRDRAWDEIKSGEHGYSSLSEELSGVAEALPSLSYAAKLIRRASKYMERDPYVQRAMEGSADCPGEQARAYLGRLLFSACAMCADRGIDPEGLLREVCEDYIAFEQRLENLMGPRDIALAGSSSPEAAESVEKAIKKCVFLQK
ncbi:MAG: MazG family protein [Eubacteriaceae bacterium]|nr:MazG family protein [Eubacteriaceae bacterium]